MTIAWRWTRVLAHFVRGWAIVVFVFPFLDQARRDLHVLEWAQRLLKLLRIKLTYRGMFPNNGCIIVANHVSWLDIFLILATRPVSFVSKAEVADWPMIGRLLKGAHTTLIERRRRKAVHEALQQMRHKLNNGLSVAFFPEGTTSDGRGLLPFHANLFEVAMQAKTGQIPLVPAAIRYLEDGQICFHAAYVSDTSLLQSIHTLIASPPIEACVEICAPLFSVDFKSRHTFCFAAREAIEAALHKYS